MKHTPVYSPYVRIPQMSNVKQRRKEQNRAAQRNYRVSISLRGIRAKMDSYQPSCMLIIHYLRSLCSL